MGFPLRKACLANCAKPSGSRTVSINKMKPSMSWSSNKSEPMPPTPTQASFPTDTNVEKLIPRSLPRDNKVPIRLPLCEITAYRPDFNCSERKAALVVQQNLLRVSTIPIELGPISKIPACFAI